MEIPCSRVAHQSKSFSAYRKMNDSTDFVGRNLKRVAEVWLDDYKNYFYRNQPKRYNKLDAGDLSKQHKLKKHLNCKPFKYFLDVVAPEMLKYFPIEPWYFASGSIQSLSKSDLCIGTPLKDIRSRLLLVNCSKSNDFMLTHERSIKHNDTNDQCIDSNRLNLYNCHHMFGSQHWKFNIDMRQIINPSSEKCLTAHISQRNITLEPCDVSNVNQKWKWSFENVTALRNWHTFGLKVPKVQD